MSVFAISFRIAAWRTALGPHPYREDTVNNAIRSQAHGLSYWAETSSIAVIKSEHESAESLAEAIDAGSALDKAVDLLVVIDLTGKGHRILGNYSDKDIDAILAQR